jgi:hypothetical protein
MHVIFDMCTSSHFREKFARRRSGTKLHVGFSLGNLNPLSTLRIKNAAVAAVTKAAAKETTSVNS